MTDRIKHTTLINQLGASSRGDRYWLGADQYVYQQLPDGTFNGWLCSFPTWESTFQKRLFDNLVAS